MITIKQAEIISAVLKRFNENETPEWTEIDEAMNYLGWLKDNEVVEESKIVLDIHQAGNAHCEKNHPINECFVPVVLQAVSYIIEDFKTSNRLAKKARYVLEYYLALAQSGVIVYG